jgi:hypothetical protein
MSQSPNTRRRGAKLKTIPSQAARHTMQLKLLSSPPCFQQGNVDIPRGQLGPSSRLRRVLRTGLLEDWII